MAKITVKNTDLSIVKINDADYISLTDIARYKTDDTSAVIGNWMRNRNTIEYFGIWETLYNQDLKPLEFEGFRKEASQQGVYATLEKHGIYQATYYSWKKKFEEMGASDKCRFARSRMKEARLQSPVLMNKNRI